MKLPGYGNARTWDIAPFVERYVDIAMALVMMTIVAMLVMPVPALLLDMAIAANFAFSMLLITVAIYIKSTLDLAVFPSLLLLTTLFRLGLSVATTKGILLHAHAGDMVQAFGTLVVGGNVVVGLVIFLLLCAVQFVVVAKGADRVAEVAARFTLDAIPGKQMSIDADLRAGSIDSHQAKQRRDILQREIQLHGAFDGAMKFVKGDAMIGIIVALINIIGGVTIGMIQRKLSFAESIDTYVILTVGDGLVSQIPSLMVAIAAGLIITRGDSDSSSGESDNLGRRIYEQLANQPRAVLMAAAAALILALVPGFPHLQFAILALLLLGVGMAKRRSKQVVASSRQAVMPNMARDGSSYQPCLLDSVEFGTTVPLRVHIGRDAFNAIVPSEFDQELGNTRRYLMQNLGLPFPGLSMVGVPGMAESDYRIEVNGVNVMVGQLYPGDQLVHGDATALADCPQSRPSFYPGSEQAYWVNSATAQAAQAAGAAVATSSELLASHIYAICYRHAAEFVGTQEAQFLLNRLKIVFPDLVAALLAKFSPTSFGRMLSGLLAEEVSIRNLRAICEALMRLPQGENSQHQLMAAARIAVLPECLPGYLDPHTGTLQVVVVDESWGSVLNNALRTDHEGEPCLALNYRDLQALQTSVKEALQPTPTSTVLLTSSALRKHLADLLKGMNEQRKVLAIEEVPQDAVIISRLGVVSRDDG